MHDLPPRQLVESDARKIGSTVGDWIEFEGQLIIAQRYLQFRADVSILKPLPAGFLQEKTNGEQFWVQFKLEKLVDFLF